MIVGRNPRTPVIGDTVLSQSDRRQGAGTIVDTDAIRYKVYWRDGRDTLRAHPPRNNNSTTGLRTVVGVTHPMAAIARVSTHRKVWRVATCNSV